MASFLVNGWPARSLDLADRGLMYGDGVFRTLVLREGRPLNWRQHLRLLARDCDRLLLACPPEQAILEDLARADSGPVAVAKVVVTRGASGRGYAFAEGNASTRIVAAWPGLPGAAGAARDGVAVRRCELRLAIQPRLAGVKSLNRLENVLARAEWADPGIGEGLLADAEGRLVEATMSNVFLVSGGQLATPSLERCGVEGAQRARVLELAAAAGIPCVVRDLGFDDLLAADEAFLTNSVIGLWPVAAFGERRWTPGPVTRRLQALVEDDDARGA